MKKQLCCLSLVCGLLAGNAGAWYSSQPSVWARSEIRAAEDSALVSSELTAGYSLAMPYYVTEKGGMTRYAFCETIGYLLALSQKTDVGTLADTQRTAGKTARFSDYQPDDAAFLTCTYGLVQGMPDGTFCPESALTRQQAAKILTLAAESVQSGSYLPSAAAWDACDLTDKAQVADWAQNYVAYAVESGLMKGVGEGCFDPQGSLTVEQGTVLAYRLAYMLGLSGVIPAGANSWMWQYGVNRTCFTAQQSAYGLCYTGSAGSAISRIEVLEAQVNALPASIASADGYQLPGTSGLGAALIHEPLKIGKMYQFQVKLKLYPADGGDAVEVTDQFTYLCGKYCTYPDDNYY